MCPFCPAVLGNVYLYSIVIDALIRKESRPKVHNIFSFYNLLRTERLLTYHKTMSIILREVKLRLEEKNVSI